MACGTRAVVSVGSVGSMEPTDLCKEVLEPMKFEGKCNQNSDYQLKPSKSLDPGVYDFGPHGLKFLTTPLGTIY